MSGIRPLDLLRSARLRLTGASAREHDGVTIVALDVGGVGGMELQLAELVSGLTAAGQPVVVVARTCVLPASELLTFVRVPGPQRPFALAYPLFLVAATLLVLRHGRGLLHTTGAVVAMRCDVSTVHYCHAAAGGSLARGRASRDALAYRLNAAVAGVLSRSAERWCYRPQRARALVAVSAGLATEVRSFFPAMSCRVAVIPNGVDSHVFVPDAAARDEWRRRLGFGADDLVAVFVGGDWDRKGLQYAIAALASAPDWRLVVAGTGDQRSALDQATAAGVAERLRLLGPVEGVASLLAAGDAFVMPTAYETFSIATYEAAACGLVLLVTRVHGVEDVLEDGVNGWFITRDAADVAARLNALAGERATLAAMGRAARLSVADFGWDAMVRRYLALYPTLRTS